MNVRDIAIRAQAYGIPGYICDGNDVLEVYRFCKKAVAHARAGNGPVLVEVKTMRMRGHAEHDDASYVPREVLEEWKKKDPIDHYVNFLSSNDLMDQEEQQALVDRVNKQVTEAEEFAVNSPLPEGSDAIKGAYADDSIIWHKPWWKQI
jgi:pyruvate dehydrogenase E1 component alpha subunit